MVILLNDDVYVFVYADELWHDNHVVSCCMKCAC